MITFETFLVGLLVVSTLTSLVTEAIKKILNSKNAKHDSNILAGIVAAGLSLMVGTGYVIMNGIAFSAQTVVCIIALMFMSWLCAMVGYDKVVQVITSFKTK